ncbi:peptidyl-tRNA hydrolase [Candidatus Woesearchaeota archaeon]|nr:peptidyl-tRNA hydrolase [Candidatus Woesearchaeota archaeon]
MKQAILIRQDLKLPKGKLAAQAAHASVEAVLKSSESKVEEWRDHGAKKVVLKVKDETELRSFLRKANAAKIITALITDAGLTVIEPGTVTVLAIGPDEDGKVDQLVGKLKLV